MTIALIIVFILSAVGVYFYVKHLKRKDANKIVPVEVGNKTIYLKKCEVEDFKSKGRASQRAVVNRMDAKIKSGKYIRIYEHGKVVGIVRKVKN